MSEVSQNDKTLTITNRPYRVVLADPDRDWLETRRRQLHGTPVKVNAATDVKTKIANHVADISPDALILGDEFEDALDLAGEIARDHPAVWIILATKKPSQQRWHRANSYGVQALLPHSFHAGQVLGALNNLGERDRNQGMTASVQQIRVDDDGHDHDSDHDATKRHENDTSKTAIKQEIIAVTSPKGGVGKTTVATNLAVKYHLMKHMDIHLCLMDLDTTFGNVGNTMFASPSAITPTLYDWREVNIDDIDATRLRQMVAEHHTGLDIIPAPINPKQAAQINPSMIRRVLQKLKEFYDVILIDTGVELQLDPTMIALQEATQILLVGTPDIPTIYDMRNFAKLMTELPGANVDPAQINIVINKVPDRESLPLTSIIDKLDYPLAGSLPLDHAVQKTVNTSDQGEIAVEKVGRSDFVKQLEEVAVEILPVSPEEDQKISIVDRLREILPWARKEGLH